MQRWSAVVFLAAFLFQAHFANAASPDWLHVALLFTVVLSGVLHLGPSAFLLVTDYVATRRAQLSSAAISLAGALLGAALPLVGVATSTATAPTPGHVAGSSCARCHTDAARDHETLSLSHHAEAGVGCESCHDVVAGARPDLERAQPKSGGTCVVCHGDAQGGWRRGEPAIAPGEPSGSADVAMPSASAPALPAGQAGPLRLCARQVADLAPGLEEASPVVVEVQSGDASKLVGGRAELELRAVMQDRELTLRARWADPTRESEDRLAVMVAPAGAVAGFDKSGCAITCHSIDPIVHRAPEGSLYEWDVSERGAGARTLTPKGYGPRAATTVSGSMKHLEEEHGAEMSIRLPDAFSTVGTASMSVAVFDRDAKAHATRTKPIVLDLSCR